MNIQHLMDHITKEIGVSDHAKYPFQAGYLIGILDDLVLRLPEARDFVEYHARKYKFEEAV